MPAEGHRQRQANVPKADHRETWRHGCCNRHTHRRTPCRGCNRARAAMASAHTLIRCTTPGNPHQKGYSLRPRRVAAKARSGTQRDRRRLELAVCAGPGLQQAFEAAAAKQEARPCRLDNLCQQVRLDPAGTHRPSRERPLQHRRAAQHLHLSMAARIDDALEHRIDAIFGPLQILQETHAIEHQDTGDTCYAIECRGIGQQAIKIGCLQIGTGLTGIGNRV
ncbi:hypothetical protein G6F65_013382 [Rhizopus arrhizus]|nr:hypothetical protein G6F68_012797 [Rhizopus microsporus]KAG1270086.1 hypothetical protein G6F65_013382 [Rhizopus arrhizus]